MLTKAQAFDEATWALIEAELNQRILNYFGHSIKDETIDSIKEIIEQCGLAHHKYKKHFPWVLYYLICFLLPFSFLLIIPAYWCWKKFKSLNAEKKKLQAAFDKSNNERIQNTVRLINTINFNEIIDQLLNALHYVRKGPLPANFLNIIKNYTDASDDWILNTPYQNPICSSWGVFNQHMLILNMAKSKHWLENKVYTRTVSFPYTVMVDNKPSVRMEVVTASYAAPYPFYKQEYKATVFTTNCGKLQFKACFDQKEKEMRRVYKNMQYTPLENNMFNKEFSVARNAEDYIRMYFTVDVQEYFVNHLKTYKDGHKFPKYFWWNKSGPFVFSNLYLQAPLKSYGDQSYNFVQEVDTDLEDIFKTCSQWVSNFVKERFLSLNVASNLPLLQTEYNDQLINKLEQASQPGLKVHADDMTTAHWIYHNIWSTPLLKTDTVIMPVMQVLSKLKIDQFVVTKATCDAHFYEGVHKQKIVRAYGARTGLHLIPVDYTEFIPKKHSAIMYYCHVKPNLFLKPTGTNLPLKALEIINQYHLTDKIRIKRNHLVFIDLDDSQSHDFSACLTALAPMIKPIN